MADLRISELAALAGANLASVDVLPVVDISASETKKITVTDLVGNATTLIADATIPGAKILFSANTIAGSALQNSSITSTQLASGSITAAKLANESTVDLVTTLPATGAFTGQLALDTDDLKVYCWNGSAWQSIKAAGSINTVIGDTAGIVNINVATSGDQVTITTSLDNTGAAGQFLGGPAGAAGAVGYRNIVGTDLPTPTTTTKGGVIVNGEGLRIDGSTLEVDNDVTASGATYGVVQYNAKGLITAGRAIAAADLPNATNSTKGAVIVGTGLAATSGTLNHSNAVTPATATKVTFDAQGHITATSTLADADIPNIPATKLTTGTLDPARLGTNAITGTKLANEATVRFGGASQTTGIVTFPTAEYKGQYFWDASNGDLYLYDGSAWQPVTITSGELVYAGAYNATNNQVASVTAAGSAAGLTVGAALPAAATGNNRYYVVVATSGTGTAPAPTVSLAPPDMILSNGATWDLIDVSNAIAGQTASNISFTPGGGIAATNVQTALQELDTEKLDKAGGTVTGILEIGSAGSLVFEGSTADANETTLAVVNPTADRTITLPDITGTVVTTGDTGTVSNTMLAGSIADTKLSTISTADKISLSAINIDGGTDIGAALADADLIIVDDGGAGTNRKAAVTRITDYTFGKVSGDITITSAGVSAIGAGVIVNADVNASAGIDHSKLATMTAGTVLIGNATGVPTATALSGDVTVTSGGVTAIGAGVIVDADVNASAAIAGTKITAATTSVVGTVQLTDSIASTSTTTAATPNSVKTAYDLANAALPKSGGTMTGTITFAGGQTLSGYAALATAQTFTAAQRGTVSAQGAVTGTVTLDFAVANNFSMTLPAGGSVTLANPTNLTAGQSGAIVITQNATTAATVAYGTNWKFSGGTPTMSTGLSSVSTLVYFVESATRITAQLLTNVA